jgi:predicted metal-dependent peptidase
VENAARNDYSWNPPNRRYVHAGLYLPSVKNEELPEIVIAVDTSGSISQGELDQFAAEVSAVLQDFDTLVTLVYCDAAVSGIQELSRFDLPLVLTPTGGGGTDYRPVFDLVGERSMEPACLIYLTDLECINYPVPPDYPVLWVSTRTGKRVPPFGEVVELSL